MAEAKIEHFSRQEKELARYCRALAHPARIRILTLLLERGECCCGDFIESLSLAQGTVSQHLRALRGEGLIQGDIEGPKSSYCVNWKKFQGLRVAMRSWLKMADNFHQKSPCLLDEKHRTRLVQKDVR